MVAIQPCLRSIRRPTILPAGCSARRVPCRVPLARFQAAVSGVRPTEDTALEVTKMTNEIVAVEARLAALFEPGKPMPRAGIVATMRQEVSEMKTQLAAIMGSVGPGTALDAAPATDDELAERARQAFLEVERLLGQKSGGANRRDDGAAIAVLEAENERLRLEATTLLMRQQQLEEVVEQHARGRKA